jgi:hypothetical protein
MVDSIDFELIDKIFAGMTEPFEKEGRSNIQLFGELLGNVLDIFLRITAATSLLLNDFLVFLVEKTDEWITSLTDGDLEGFFADAGVYAGRLGTIIGNVFTGLGNLIGLTTGPGSAGNDMLTWMEEATGTFATMFSEDPEAGKTFFKDAFANARSVMSSIGALLMEILKLADNPNIKIAFDQLKEGAPALGEMLGKMIDAGPSFATFLSTVTEIANKLTDDDQISAFFDTLNEGASAFNDFLDGDIAKGLLDKLGPLFATLSALGVLFDVVKFGFNVLIGYLIFSLDVFAPGLDKIKGGFGGVMTKVGGLSGLLKGAGLIGLFVILITKAVEFYEKFESFKTMIDNVFGGVKESFDRLMEGVGELFGKLFGSGDGSLLGALDPVIKIILETLIPVLGYVLQQILNALTFVVDFANTILDVVMPIIEKVAEAIGLLFEGDVGGFFTAILEAMSLLVVGIIQLVINGIIDMVNFGIRGVNNLIGLITNGPLGDFMRDVFDVDLSDVRISEISNVDIVGRMQRNMDANDRKKTNQGIQDSTSGFGGPDRRAMSSMTSSSMSSKVTDSAVYKDYAAKQDINVTINGSNMTSKEQATEIGRQISRQTLRGTM